MPPLSEAWATAYIQILTMLIIFVLGIPALTLQLVVQEDIRNVFHRRWKATVWYFLVVVILAALIAFVWFLHPPFESRDSNNSAVDVPLTIRPLAETNPNTPGERFAVSVGPARPVTAASKNEDTSYRPLIAGCMMTLIPLCILFVGFKYAGYLKRDNIIKELEKELIVNFRQEDETIKRLRAWLAGLNDLTFRKQPRKRRSKKRRSRSARTPEQAHHRHLDAEALDDLIYLGRNGKAGNEKKLVLDALDKIAAQVQRHVTYQGDELEDLIKGLRDIVTSSEQPGNDDNFNQVVDILKKIKYDSTQEHAHKPKDKDGKKVKRTKYIDAGLVDTILGTLGTEAVKTKSEQTAERFLEVASFSSQILFKMGLAALYDKHFHTAILALNKLEALAEEKTFATCSETYDLLGLIAHFTVCGTATRKRANYFLSHSKSDFKPSIEAFLKKAYDHHYDSSNFDTADALAQLQIELIGGH